MVRSIREKTADEHAAESSSIAKVSQAIVGPFTQLQTFTFSQNEIQMHIRSEALLACATSNAGRWRNSSPRESTAASNNSTRSQLNQPITQHFNWFNDIIQLSASVIKGQKKMRGEGFRCCCCCWLPKQATPLYSDRCLSFDYIRW